MLPKLNVLLMELHSQQALEAARKLVNDNPQLPIKIIRNCLYRSEYIHPSELFKIGQLFNQYLNRDAL